MTPASSHQTQQAIADRLGVARSVVSELLARVGPAPVQDVLPATDDTEPVEPVDPAVAEPDVVEATEPDLAPVLSAPVATPVAASAGSGRIATGVHRCRYAGAMLLYPYLRRVEAGPVVGLAMIPELATLRARLSALADGSDPLGLQRAFAAGMLSADPAGDPVYFVDDDFVPYSGARPVAKGWNTKRRHAQPGRDDTLLVDARGRAVVYGSGEPTSLSSTLPGVLAQLRQVLGPHAPVLLGFDRGGAYRPRSPPAGRPDSET